MPESEKHLHLYEIRGRISELREAMQPLKTGLDASNPNGTKSLVNDLKEVEEKKKLALQHSALESEYRTGVRVRVEQLVKHREEQLLALGEGVRLGFVTQGRYSEHADAYTQTLGVIESNFPGIFKEIESSKTNEPISEPKAELSNQDRDLRKYMEKWPLLATLKRERYSIEKGRVYDLKQQGEDSLFRLFPEDMLNRSWGALNRFRNCVTRSAEGRLFQYFGIKALLALDESDIEQIRGVGDEGIKLFRLMKAVAQEREKR